MARYIQYACPDTFVAVGSGGSTGGDVLLVEHVSQRTGLSF